jgi:hypothetical protein
VTSRLEILNLALAAVSEQPTPAETGAAASNAAIKLARFLDLARDEVLGRHGWIAAMEYRELAAAAEAGDWKYPYRFYLPPDCLRVWRVENEGAAWEAGQRLLAGEERQIVRSDAAGPLRVAYVRRMGWDGLPPHLVNPIALLAGARGGETINGSAEMAGRLEQRAELAIARAMGLDGTQQGGRDVPLPSRPAAIRASAG